VGALPASGGWTRPPNSRLIFNDAARFASPTDRSVASPTGLYSALRQWKRTGNYDLFDDPFATRW
jgi:hypothetical protein